MRENLIGIDGHEEQQHRSNHELDKSPLSVTLNVLTTVAIIIAAMVIAILLNVMHALPKG